jgi:hypothetical protein
MFCRGQLARRILKWISGALQSISQRFQSRIRDELQSDFEDDDDSFPSFLTPFAKPCRISRFSTFSVSSE